MKQFDLHVLTMNKPFFEGKCVSLIVPIKDGQYGILADHCNWISAVVPGEMKITIEGDDGKRSAIVAAVAGGIVKAENNSVLVLVDTAERPEDIDENRARRAVQMAKEQTAKQTATREYYSAQARLARAVNRLRVRTHNVINDR